MEWQFAHPTIMNLEKLPPDEPDQDANATTVPPRRQNKFPLWIVFLLVFFVGMRIIEVVSTPGTTTHSRGGKAKSADSGVDSDSLQDLIATDVSAKTAFASTYANFDTDMQPKRATLISALNRAELFDRETKNTPSAARRLMILRELLGKPPFEVSKHGYNPLDAFSASIPKGLRQVDIDQLKAEGTVWSRLFGAKPLSKKDLTELSPRVNSLPNIRWWKYPALMAAYGNAHDKANAAKYFNEARSHAAQTMVPVIALSAARIGLVLLGIVLLLGILLFAAFRSPENGINSFPEIWPNLPPILAQTDKKLTASDLFGVFVLYLATGEVIGALFIGLTGFGTHHILAFGGVFSHYHKAIDALSATQRSSLSITLESIVYVVSALPPVGYLIMLAKKRGADLGAEIGWTKRSLGLNILYGVGGFAISSPLIIFIGIISNRVFKHAPDPSNPIIPLMVGASGLWVQIVLVILAAIAAPFVEELLFRGALYNALKLSTGVWPAIIISGCVFGFIHPVGIAEMITLASFGILLAWMAETRKSLAPGMVAHCLQNLTTTLLLLCIMSG